MIDINKAKETFIEYVKGYDIENGRIKLKMIHILNVADTSRKIATHLGLDEEQVNLAELIGIFHDIGRFEQVRLYDTFSDRDSGLDHAAYSLKVLYEDGLIHKFIDTDKYDEIIKKAVFYHNKATIGEEVEGDALLFAKIIRDADKMDIYRVINTDPMIDIFWYKDFSDKEISPKVIEDYKNTGFVSYKDIKNNADQIVVFLGYVYDFNFPYCLKIIREERFLDRFIERVNETFESEDVIRISYELLKGTNEFMDEKIKEM